MYPLFTFQTTCIYVTSATLFFMSTTRHIISGPSGIYELRAHCPLSGSFRACSSTQKSALIKVKVDFETGHDAIFPFIFDGMQFGFVVEEKNRVSFYATFENGHKIADGNVFHCCENSAVASDLAGNRQHISEMRYLFLR